MRDHSAQGAFSATEMSQQHLSRRQALKLGIGALGTAATALGILEAVASSPKRLAHAAPGNLPSIQYDISNYIAPVQTLSGIDFRFGPVYTLFLTAQLTRTPTKADQKTLSDALDTLEASYTFSPSGLFTCISYGIPYFNRLPGGLSGSLVASHIPRLLSDTKRLALEEAVPGPTDVVPGNNSRDHAKQKFNVPVVIEKNDLLFTLRSDSLDNLNSVVAWLKGSQRLNGQFVPSPAFAGLFNFTSTRLMFVQSGLPRKIADFQKLPYAGRIHPDSPMWMGFADQQVNGAGPAAITTFQGNSSARLTDATSQSYFADGSIQHLSHVIEDLEQFYADKEAFDERVRYMFRANPIPSEGYADPFTNGGGPAFLANTFQGPDDALHNAQGINTFEGTPRICHLSGLQRSSRAADGTPMHIRADGPGFDTMDVPDGSDQPKLQFSIFVPTANFFATMRQNAASLDYYRAYKHIKKKDIGLERFTTTTRRQNFLVPPRAHRAFPLLELT
jgi:hypothetical protein